ncbi:MAG: hypothetical protein ACT4OO_06300 [Nitrospiraceae bacterium]
MMQRRTSLQSRASVGPTCRSAQLRDQSIIDAKKSAKIAGLQYVSDHHDGIHRTRHGTGFHYSRLDDTPVKDREILRRIRTLAIPPAWNEVWICNRADGHLQATGRDARGRKQYRYHPKWRDVRDQTKYDRLLALGRLFP